MADRISATKALQAKTPPEQIDTISFVAAFFRSNLIGEFDMAEDEKGIGRRGLFKAAGVLGTVALLEAARQALPAGAYAAPAGPEVKGAKLGFIALTREDRISATAASARARSCIPILSSRSASNSR